MNIIFNKTLLEGSRVVDMRCSAHFKCPECKHLLPMDTARRLDAPHLQLVPPRAPTPVPAPGSPAVSSPSPPSRSKRVGVAIGALVAVLAGLGYATYGYHFEETEDAHVDANISTVSTRTSGTVTRVLVSDNAQVKAGDVLFELDDRDARVAVDIARASLVEAEAELAAEAPAIEMTEVSNQTRGEIAAADVARARAAISFASRSRAQANAQLAQARASLTLARSELDRAQTLYAPS